MLSPTKSNSAQAHEKSNLVRSMEMIWSRIEERYGSFSQAFRLFDRAGNGHVTIDSFMMGLEAMHAKLSSKDSLEVFKHLDEGQKGYIVYKDFCNLCDERRLNVDPASAMFQEYAQMAKGGKRGVKSPSRRQ